MKPHIFSAYLWNPHYVCQNYGADVTTLLGYTHCLHLRCKLILFQDVPPNFKIIALVTEEIIRYFLPLVCNFLLKENKLNNVLKLVCLVREIFPGGTEGFLACLFGNTKAIFNEYQWRQILIEGGAFHHPRNPVKAKEFSDNLSLFIWILVEERRKMTVFEKRGMIQTIHGDTWDVGVVQHEGSFFLFSSYLGRDFTVYKWFQDVWV